MTMYAIYNVHQINKGKGQCTLIPTKNMKI